MVQLSQTSWQEFSLSNVVDTMRYSPVRVQIGKAPTLVYTLPESIEPGEIVSYRLQNGFSVLKWTGIISAVNGTSITVRLGNGPFRGFTAHHDFVSDGSMTTCHDEMSFQGFTDFSEDTFASIMSKASVIYAIDSRKEAQAIKSTLQPTKPTRSFGAIDQSATAG